MKKLTMSILRSWAPCYDPIKYLPENFEGTIRDILMHDTIPYSDKLWCALRTEVTTERTMRLFAVWSYRQTLQWVGVLDPRSVEAANVSERFAMGQATHGELSEAREGAQAAVRAALRAARAAAGSAVLVTLESARSAARSASGSAGWAAACSAKSAGWAAAWSAKSEYKTDSARVEDPAAESAAWLAWVAAKKKQEKAQIVKLLEMIEAEDAST